jgi:hypothetical protein
VLLKADIRSKATVSMDLPWSLALMVRTDDLVEELARARAGVTGDESAARTAVIAREVFVVHVQSAQHVTAWIYYLLDWHRHTIRQTSLCGIIAFKLDVFDVRTSLIESKPVHVKTAVLQHITHAGATPLGARER